MNTQTLLITLLLKKYKNVKNLLEDLSKKEEHSFFIFAKDFAKEILQNDSSYNFIVNLVDDLHPLIKKELQDYLKKYYLNVLFVTKKNKLTAYLENDDVVNAVKWLLSRYVNLLKNLFDKKRGYKVIDNIQYLYFNSIDNGEELISSSFYRTF